MLREWRWATVQPGCEQNKSSPQIFPFYCRAVAELMLLQEARRKTQAGQLWLPMFKIQTGRVTGVTGEMENLFYERRLKEQGLFSLIT